MLDIEAYVPGESHVAGGVKPIKLSSNETPLGPSPKAVAAFAHEPARLVGTLHVLDLAWMTKRLAAI